MIAGCSEAVISDVLCCGPEVQIGSEREGWRLSRWRHFVGSYALPALPEPLFVVHIAGKPGLRTWRRDGWSDTGSIPGDVTILPAGQPTRFLVDGELDATTLSLSPPKLAASGARGRFEAMRFAFPDPLGAVLVRRVLGELYAPSTPERDLYIQALTDALNMHVLREPAFNGATIAPERASVDALQGLLRDVAERPGADHSLATLAERAGVAPSELCRRFRTATGLSPRHYVTKARVERAEGLLAGSDMPLAAIAHVLGFNDQSHFTRVFSRSAGCTPGEFRRRRAGRRPPAGLRIASV